MLATNSKMMQAAAPHMSPVHPSCINTSDQPLATPDLSIRMEKAASASSETQQFSENDFEDVCAGNGVAVQDLLAVLDYFEKDQQQQQTKQEPLDEEDVIIYECLYCDRRFDTSETVQEHTRKHLDELQTAAVVGKRKRGQPKAKGSDRYSLDDASSSSSSTMHVSLSSASVSSHTSSASPVPGMKLEPTSTTMTKEYSPIQQAFVNDGNNSSYDCEQCGLEFASVGYLRQHAVVHSDVKKFACEQCPEAFRRVSELKLHYKAHHANGFRCLRCLKLCDSYDSLLTHVKEHHPGKRPFQCKLCPQSFDAKADLATHHKQDHPKLVNDVTKPKKKIPAGRQASNNDTIS
ncbi:hypothetical protein BJ741DRAFT_587070 [Chytriomyces cf. hyalinus JEL632]|nr:hypothetical protein BJ741DRAFT_587070 [Chytriomyces cf. hyalinus JEL632]